MVCSFQRICRCPSCKRPIWSEDAREVEWPRGFSYKDGAYREAGAEDYELLLSEGGLPADREISLRTYSWWLDNKPRREQGKNPRIEFSEAALENMHALERLLAAQEDDASKLSRAELLRQLGRFCAVEPLLASLPADYETERQQRIRELNAAKNRWVGFIGMELFSGGFAAAGAPRSREPT